MPIPLGILAAAGFRPAAGGSYELIETYTVGAGGLASVTFSNLNTYSTTYQHLQIRAIARTAETGSNLRGMAVRLNGVSTASYAWHALEGQGSSVSSFGGTSATNGYIGHLAAAGASSGIFGASVIDILDPYETSKNTTLRGLSGATSSGENRVRLYSTLFNSTASITSITLYSENLTSNFVEFSRFSIYGLKASA